MSNAAQYSGISGLRKKDSMAPMPHLFYQLIIGNERMKRNAMIHVSSEVIEQAISFTQDQKLKQTMYKCLQSRTLSDGSRSQSIIINELTGLYGFAKKFVKYGVITVKMHMDKS